MIGHVHDHARGILTTCQAYMKGINVGSNINEGKEMTGSNIFKKDVERYMKTLVKAFQNIGVVGLEFNSKDQLVLPPKLVPPPQPQLVLPLKLGSPPQERTHKSLTQKIKAFFCV